jgi:hypothetical protein
MNRKSNIMDLTLSKRNQYKLIDKITTIGVAIGTRTLFKQAWTAFKGRRPPENPTDPEVYWRDAAMWGAAVGLAVGFTKVIMKVALDESWQEYMGSKPADE